MLSVLASLLIEASTVLGPAQVSAAEPATADNLQLDYRAPASCADEMTVRAAIDAYLGHDVLDPGVKDVRIGAEISALDGEGGFGLRVLVSGAGIQVDRQVEGPMCDELATAAGLMIAVALDPLRASEVTPPSPSAPRSELKLEAEPAPSDAAGSEPALDTASPIRASVRLGGGVSYGVSPEVAAAVLGSVGVGRRLWRVDLVGHWSSPRVDLVVATDDAGVRVQAGSAGIQACVVPSHRSFEFSMCVAGHAGVMRARGAGISAPATVHRPWFAVGFGQQIAWIPGRLGLFLASEGLASLLRPSFGLQGHGEVFLASPVGLRVIAGPQARF